VGAVRTLDVDAVVAAYEAALSDLVDPEGPRALRVAYTPLHGVGGAVVPGLLRRAGFDVVVVSEQAEPDPAFPTVPFPNLAPSTSSSRSPRGRGATSSSRTTPTPTASGWRCRTTAGGAR
jgi:phosphomannomutase